MEWLQHMEMAMQYGISLRVTCSFPISMFLFWLYEFLTPWLRDAIDYEYWMIYRHKVLR